MARTHARPEGQRTRRRSSVKQAEALDDCDSGLVLVERVHVQTCMHGAGVRCARLMPRCACTWLYDLLARDERRSQDCAISGTMRDSIALQVKVCHSTWVCTAVPCISKASCTPGDTLASRIFLHICTPSSTPYSFSPASSSRRLSTLSLIS